eukprot:6387774-Pyramimonas_sp.AAC.1
MGPRFRDHHLGGFEPGLEGRDRVLLVRKRGTAIGRGRRHYKAVLYINYVEERSPQVNNGGAHTTWVVAVHAVPLPR